MQMKKNEQSKVTSFGDMKKLVTPSTVFDIHEFVIKEHLHNPPTQSGR